MHEGIITRDRIAILIYSMVNAVLFGVGLVVVLNVPLFAAHLWIGIPVVVLTSLILGAPVAWLIAPRLRARKNPRSAAIETERSLRSSQYRRYPLSKPEVRSWQSEKRQRSLRRHLSPAAPTPPRRPAAARSSCAAECSE